MSSKINLATMISLDIKALGFFLHTFFILVIFSQKIDEAATTANMKKVGSWKKPLPLSSMFLFACKPLECHLTCQCSYGDQGI